MSHMMSTVMHKHNSKTVHQLRVSDSPHMVSSKEQKPKKSYFVFILLFIYFVVFIYYSTITLLNYYYSF